MMTTDIERLTEFFNTMGVPYNMWVGSHYIRKDSSVIYLTVAQAHFIFTHHGELLGVDSDENGVFEPRRRG